MGVLPLGQLKIKGNRSESPPPRFSPPHTFHFPPPATTAIRTRRTEKSRPTFMPHGIHSSEYSSSPQPTETNRIISGFYDHIQTFSSCARTHFLICLLLIQ